MGALRAAQFEYDNRMPPAVSEVADAESTWIDDGIAELMARRDVVFQRRMRPKQGVTYERFAQAVDEFVMGQLGQSDISNSVLGRLVLAARSKVTSDAAAAADEILSVANPESALEEIARQLLTPFAREGVLAQAEAEL
ncbi:MULTISPECIES: hypothetical protein [Pseudomonas]|jgi:hypothetical protein|uniref:hypothetical protein n=1 Tax=Pseudomonas TaxID=286 RepID=UPI0002A15720|nr:MULTISPECIES: hypothetical protein [Pseudomonas]AGA72940.1 hypothetical protein B479_10190 [Pseudomonas putida HB3267]KGK25529.1 hypothetical protein GT93_12060 [Pseudomonas plecoglossicida]MCE0946458.1 hypothetical protein [Pseudomonas asiatica]MCE1033063.1 hypothetical protein [Pseudomonas asiatica]MCE1067590.1 hypothetical protein [Pseudomonas asiatica]